MSFPNEEIAVFQEIFDAFDQNGDGKLSFSELKTALREAGHDLSDQEIWNAIRKNDFNGDGMLNFDEFLEMMAKFTFEQMDEQRRDHEEIMEAFRIFDRDGSGYITRDELKATMARMGEHMSDYQLEDMLAEADSDGDGKISYEEFAQAMYNK